MSILSNFGSRRIAALALCVIGAAFLSCAGERPAAEVPAAVTPQAEPSSEPASPPEVPAAEPAVPSEPRTPPLSHPPVVRILVAESQQPIRVRIPAAFFLGETEDGASLARQERGGDFTVKCSAAGVSILEGKKTLHASGCVTVRPAGLQCVYLNGKPYRGGFLFRPTAKGVAAINVLALDDYLKGVVPSEIGYHKPELYELYRAQALAARTYAVSKLEERRSEPFDLSATVADQVYNGVTGEYLDASRAVDETRGFICTFLGQPVRTYYSACCGGHTSDIRVVWPWKTPYPYLYGVRDTLMDRDGQALCAGSRHFRWNVRWTGAELAAILRRTLPKELSVAPRSVGRLVDIGIDGIGEDGRVAALSIVTDRGTHRVEGDRIRWVLMTDPDAGVILKSTMFTMNVRRAGGEVVSVELAGGGNGHGVGMCQSGAIRMAELGASAEAILRHYYPGIVIERLYR